MTQQNFDLPKSTTRENQAGFRPGYSCVDHIFSLRQILELYHEFRQPIYVEFLYFSAAFDSVDRQTLWKLLRYDGLPPKLCSIIQALYKNTTSQVSVYNRIDDKIKFSTGVRQGSIISPNYVYTISLAARLT